MLDESCVEKAAQVSPKRRQSVSKFAAARRAKEKERKKEEVQQAKEAKQQGVDAMSLKRPQRPLRCKRKVEGSTVEQRETYEDQPLPKIARGIDPLEILKEILEDEACLPSDMPRSALQMLAAVCNEVCAEVRKDSKAIKHKFLTSVLDMMKEAVSKILEMRNKMAEAALQEANDAMADTQKFDELASACEEKLAALEDGKNEVAEEGAKLSRIKENLAETLDSEKAASTSLVAAEKIEKACFNEKQTAEAALKTFEALESTGPPAKASDLKKMIKEVEGQMQALNVQRTLFPRVVNAIIPALQTKPSDRSSFEDGALVAAEGCFTNFIKEKADLSLTLGRGTTAARERVRRSRHDVEQVRQAVEAHSKALKNAKDAQKECEIDLKEAEKYRKDHKDHVAMLSKRAKAQARALADVSKVGKALAALSDGD